MLCLFSFWIVDGWKEAWDEMRWDGIVLTCLNLIRAITYRPDHQFLGFPVYGLGGVRGGGEADHERHVDRDELGVWRDRALCC